MTLIDRARWAILPPLAIVVLLSCGDPAGRSAAFRPAAEPSPPKGGEPVGALPSLVVTGQVARYRAAPPDAGAVKRRDAPGSLPSTVAAGTSAAYAPAPVP